MYGAQLTLFGWCMTGHHVDCIVSGASVSNPEDSQTCSCACHNVASRSGGDRK